MSTSEFNLDACNICARTYPQLKLGDEESVRYYYIECLGCKSQSDQYQDVDDCINDWNSDDESNEVTESLEGAESTDTDIDYSIATLVRMLDETRIEAQWQTTHVDLIRER